MPEWAARVEIEGSPAESAVLVVSTRLADNSPAVGTTDAGTLVARIALEAADLRNAVDAALQLVTDAARAAGLGETVVAVEVTSWQDFERVEALRPRVPELWGGIEVAECLKVSPRRVRELASDHPDFPKKVAHPRCGALYLAAEVRTFEKGWDRKPGRPRTR
ncbi:hypothetical protein [Embleya sp. MST-111070]|uniref:hypothetical protein n=1 Tax=Embleya sp. MST-111070 TaxID=3398231 RepID=UPI003F73EDFD